MNAKITGSAIFSECGEYRYVLSRIWDRDNPRRVLFIMLNPSTADAKQNDPTIRRCIGFAERLGYGGVYVCNLFALRSTDPKALYKSGRPSGHKNGFYIHRTALKDCGGEVICAWGNHGALHNAGQSMVIALKRWGIHPKCLGITKTGEPKHPLYLRKDSELISL